MKKWQRAAEMNKNLIIALVVLVIIAGGFYVIKWRKAASERAAIAAKPPVMMKLWCAACEKTSEVSRDEAENVEKDPETGRLKCPACGEFKGYWGRPRGKGDIVLP